MNHLFNLLFLTLLWLNLLGLSLAGARLTGLPHGLAKTVTVLLGCMVFFFIEHFVGLGGLGWLLPVSTVASLWVIWRERTRLQGCLGGELAFFLGFAYALLWRYTYPDINPSSEKLADLNFVASYLAGTRLPCADLWLAPYSLTQYYSFQHYCAALMGRVLQVPCGTAYNVGYAVLVGLVLAPAREFIRGFTTSRTSQTLILAALLMGGTGACLFTPLLVQKDKESLFSSMRFIGATDADSDEVLTPMGQALRAHEYGAGPLDEQAHEKILEMPMEIFAYVVQLGDYHAPLGGYALMTTALAAFGVLLGRPEKRVRRWAWGALLGTVPLCIVVNTWSLPLHGMLVIFLLVFLMRYREWPVWPELFGVTLVTCLLLYPCFSYFLPRTVGAGMSIELLKPDQHPPLISWLMQMWPILTLTVLGWFGAGTKREFRWFSVLLVGFLILLETVNVNDLYGGRYERFNTTLKWWPWVGALALLLLAPLNLAAAAGQRVVRIGTLAVLFAALFFIRALAREWYRPLKPAIGQLDGADWIRRDDVDPNAPQNAGVNQTILNYLQAHPEGVCLQAPQKDEKGFDRMGFVETGAIPLFTGHPTVFGWASHEQLWRGYQCDVEQRWNRARDFFNGELAQPLDYLDAWNVRFILWPGTEKVDAVLFDKISGQISSRYIFIRMDEGDPHRGIWQRR